MGVSLIIRALLIGLIQAVLCRQWDVTLPQSIVGINGSCVTVLCSFEVPELYEANVHNCSNGGQWRRGSVSGPTVLKSQNSDKNIVKGQIVGALARKNCTTHFTSFPPVFSDFLFFRIECPNPAKFTFTKGVHISFQPGFRPTLLSSGAHVSAGVRLSLRCRAPVPCTNLPPTLTWLHP
ncbi:myelin-associated glycoprotein-like, partial [Genypterus blacodes]|uniref:myelin-associated glycoprotein-like n=1 Tax=Genypterus blacodes TaxID=154954 RepID=UPI003F772FFA